MFDSLQQERKRRLHKLLQFPRYAAALAGYFLLTTNIAGLFMPLRSPLLNREGKGTTSPLPFKEAEDRLAALSAYPQGESVMAANRVFSEAMVHLPHDYWAPDDPRFEDYRLRIPIWENYCLWALRHIKPDTYRAYEFMDYRRALARGIGQCGQKSTALIGYLCERGFRTAYVYVPGHVLVTAEVEPGTWYLLDPHFKVCIPCSASEVSPAVVEKYYRQDSNNQSIKALAAGSVRIIPGGPQARFPRAAAIETAAYALKWPLPIALIVVTLLPGRTGINRWRTFRGKATGRGHTAETEE